MFRKGANRSSVADCRHHQASLEQRVGSIAKSAVGVRDEILNEAEKPGGQAMHATPRGATAAVDAVETQIKRNRSSWCSSLSVLASHSGCSAANDAEMTLGRGLAKGQGSVE